MNITLYPKQEEDLLVLLGEDPKQLFESSDRPQEALYCYGKGAGKDFMVSCVMTWACHVLLCLKDPAVYLGQAPGENIDVLTVAYSLIQAKTVLFFKIKQRIKSCQWFRDAIANLTDIPPERYFRDGAGFVGAEEITFPGNLRLWSLPATDAAEGKNPILWCADEIAAFASPVRINQAQHIHRILKSSARTRFGDRWKGFMISYPRHGEDYVMQQKRLVDTGVAQKLYVVVRPTWEVNLSVTRASLDEDYRTDPEGSECRYECKPPAPVAAYFRSPEALLLNAWGAPMSLLKEKLRLPDEQLEKIASRGRSPLAKVDQGGDPILDNRGFPHLHDWFRGKQDFGGHDYEYYVHLDPGATNDSFGFAIGHNHQLLDGTLLPTIDLAFRWSGRQFKGFGEIYREQYFPDESAQTQIVDAAEVDFRTVREFIFYLRYKLGFNIYQVSMDNWNSIESRQALEQRDFQTIIRVVSKQDYDQFKTLIYTRRLRYYAYPVLIKEAYKLELINGSKVDAPRTKLGSEAVSADSHKDVSDAVAAVSRYLAIAAGFDAIEVYNPTDEAETVEPQESNFNLTPGANAATFNPMEILLNARDLD